MKPSKNINTLDEAYYSSPADSIDNSSDSVRRRSGRLVSNESFDDLSSLGVRRSKRRRNIVKMVDSDSD
jgi:hypothetical protein